MRSVRKSVSGKAWVVNLQPPKRENCLRENCIPRCSLMTQTRKCLSKSGLSLSKDAIREKITGKSTVIRR